jgi:hypothetical protein
MAKGWKMKPEHRKKLSEAKKGKYIGENNPWYGRHHTAVAKLKMKKAHTGKILSEQHKKNIGLAGLGKKLSEEHKNKIHLALANKRRDITEKRNRAYSKQTRTKYVNRTCSQCGLNKTYFSEYGDGILREDWRHDGDGRIICRRCYNINYRAGIRPPSRLKPGVPSDPMYLQRWHGWMKKRLPKTEYCPICGRKLLPNKCKTVSKSGEFKREGCGYVVMAYALGKLKKE